MPFYVYLLASGLNGTLYAGYTDDLVRRIIEQREKVRPECFTAKYDVTRLVWYELHPTREEAWLRERRIKEWKRDWKVDMIRRANPNWRDLFDEIVSHGL